MLLKCALSLFVLNFASTTIAASAGAPIISPAASTTLLQNNPTPTPAPAINSNSSNSVTPAIPAPVAVPVIVPPLSSVLTPTIPPALSPIAPIPAIAPILSIAPIAPFTPTTLPQINFQPQSTTIQPLAASYQLKSTSTQGASTSTQTAPSSTQGNTTSLQSSSTLASELEKANQELDLKHKKEYDRVVQDNIELLKEKENVLVQLHAQLKLQLEAQKFAAQQRARAIKEMQDKLKKEEEKSKKDAEEMKLNVQSIVDLSPLILNVNQPKEKAKDASQAKAFDFGNLKKVQKAAKKCKKRDKKSECGMHSNICTWGRIPKQKKHKCLFMCEKLSKNHCKKVSGCYFKKHKCRNK